MKELRDKIYYGARYYGLRLRGTEWLFVLGHMRSGSSLLVHLLNSNPEILGYGETHLEYAGRRSLVRLHDDVCYEFEKHGEIPDPSYRYVMDKILWPHIRNKSLLREAPFSVIVIARKPTAALPSIVALGLEKIRSPEKALKYYIRRLNQIQDILKNNAISYVFVTYERITNRTNEALLEMSKYLQLGERLAPRYDTMWSTGKPGIGDPSEKIEEGRVRSDRSSYDVSIDSQIIEQAREKYRQFCAFCSNTEH